MTTASDTPISPGFVRIALAVEKYVLPWVYALFAWQRWGIASAQYQQCRMLERFSDVSTAALNIAYATLTKDVLLFFLMIFTGVTLLFSRPPVVRPDKFKHVIVPLAMAYYFFLYGLVDAFPPALRRSLLPPALQGLAAIGGLFLAVVGYAIVIWAFCHLGRSFAILVSVRKVVSSGPYVYVRHPIYLGYAIELCGLLLANSSIAMLLLGAGFMMFLVWRARIEEEKLCEADEGYRQYLDRTGFLFPRLSKR